MNYIVESGPSLPKSHAQPFVKQDMDAPFLYQCIKTDIAQLLITKKKADGLPSA
jgi:hypothetical protein